VTRRSLLASLAVLSLGGCSRGPAVTKRIAAKDSPVENRVSVLDTATGGGSVRTKSTTVYYLIAEDGTACEVGMSAWHRTKVGDSFTSSGWEEK
jgi:hypothetical protein